MGTSGADRPHPRRPRRPGPADRAALPCRRRCRRGSRDARAATDPRRDGSEPWLRRCRYGRSVTPAEAWITNGVASLTGSLDGPGLVPPAGMLDRIAALGAAVGVDPFPILVE